MNKETEQKQTVYNIISSVLIGGINFFTAPIFTRMLGTEQYGLFSVAYSWVTILLCFMGLQTKESLATAIHDYKKDYYRFRNSILFFGIFLSALLFVVLCVFLSPIKAFTGYSAPLIIIIFVTSFSHYIIGFVHNTCIFEKKAQVNLLISVSLVFFVVICSVIFINNSPADERYYGRLLGFTIPYTIYAIVICICLFLKQPVGYNGEYWHYSFVFGYPIVFHMLSSVILSQSDRVMMQMFDTPEADIGVYSFYFALVGVLTLVKEALNSSWRPFYYDYLSANNVKLIKTKCKNHIELFTVITCAFLLVSREVGILMAGKDYAYGVALLPVLVMCVYFTFIYQFPVNYELYYKKTQIVAICTVAAAIINIVLNSLLIPRYGMYGAGVATAMSYFSLAVIHFLISKKIVDRNNSLSLKDFILWMVFIAFAIFLFYYAAELWILRWSLAICSGVYELVKIIKRKSIF